MSTNKAGGSEKVTVIDREDSKILKARSMPAIPVRFRFTLVF